MRMEDGNFKFPEEGKLPRSEDKDAKKRERKRKRRTAEAVEVVSPLQKRSIKPPARTSSLDLAKTGSNDLSNNISFYEQTYSLYLPLAPISQQYAIPGLCAEHLSPLILVYYPPFQGVIVSYSNPRLSLTPHISAVDGRQKAYARSVDEYAASFTWLTADFLVFRPQKGSFVEGHIVLQSESNIGLVCLNYFSASIDRRHLPKDWKWIGRSRRGNITDSPKSPFSKVGLSAEEGEDDASVLSSGLEETEGYFRDGAGMRIKGILCFRVRQLITSRGVDREHSFLGIEGTMLNDEDEDEIQRKNATDLQSSQSRLNGDWGVMSGALPDTHGHNGAIDS